MSRPNNIYFSKIPKGTKVHNSQGWVFILTKDKKWSDKTFSGTVIYGPEDQIGRYEPDWCADIAYTHEKYPCE